VNIVVITVIIIIFFRSAQSRGSIKW